MILVVNKQKDISMNWYTRLTFTSGSSFKEYNVEIKPNDNNATGFDVHIAYGRIGSTLNRSIKNQAPLDINSAVKEATKVINGKLRKGYSIDSESKDLGSANSFAPASNNKSASAKPKKPTTPSFSAVTHDITSIPVSAKSVEFGVQLINPTTIEKAATFLSDNWFTNVYVQIKADGERRVVFSDGSAVFAYNKKGEATENICPKVKEAVLAIGKGKPLTLDTEDMGSHLMIFDVLAFNGVDYQRAPFEKRIEGLNNVNEAIIAKQIVLLSIIKPIVVNDIQHLEKIIDYYRNAKEEGVVLRSGEGMYTKGRPNSGGDVLKIKNINSCSCVVIGHTANRRSVSLAMMDNNDTLVSVGKVTIPQNHNIPPVNAIVEVEYLYVNGAKGALYQPVYKCDRSEHTTIEDVSINQLVYKKEPINKAA
jgi:ATP-dependent DNA ligase